MLEFIVAHKVLSGFAIYFAVFTLFYLFNVVQVKIHKEDIELDEIPKFDFTHRECIELALLWPLCIAGFVVWLMCATLSKIGAVFSLRPLKDKPPVKRIHNETTSLPKAS